MVVWIRKDTDTLGCWQSTKGFGPRVIEIVIQQGWGEQAGVVLDLTLEDSVAMGGVVGGTAVVVGLTMMVLWTEPM